MKHPLLLPALLAALALSCTRDAVPLERALSGHRPFLLRLSFQQDHTRCEPATTADPAPALFAPLECAPPRERVARRITRRAAALRQAHDDVATLGRLDLLTAGTATAYDRAVHSLEAAAVDDSSAAVLNDLAVAYAVRGAAARSALDMLRALDAVLRASRIDTTFEPAVVNRAILLQRLALAGLAATSRAGDPWLRDVAAHDPAAAAIDLQRIREDSARGALARWGAAVLDGAERRAQDALEDARRYGDMLVDASVAEAVAGIDALGPAERTRRARAHTAYQRGEALFARALFGEALASLDSAAADFADTSSPFAAWNALARAGVLLYDGSPGIADSIAADVIERYDAARFPALIGRAHWVRALTASRLGVHEVGIRHYDIAVNAYARAREAENRGAVEFQLGQAMLLLGQARTAEVPMIEGIRTLSAFPSSPRLHDSLLGLGRHATSLGLYAAARAIHEEGLLVAQRTGRRKDPGEVHVRLAQNAVAAGAAGDAHEHLAAARAIYEQVQDSTMRQRGGADIRDTEGALVLDSQPAEAVRLLGDAVAYFTELQNAPGSIRALTRRATALRLQQRHAEAALDLERAIALYELNLRGANAGTRAALQESAAAAYDAMIATQLALDEPVRALDWLMRSRGSTTAAVERAARSMEGRALAYALLPDELVVWAWEGKDWRATRVSVAAADVAQQVRALLAGDLRAADSLHALLVPVQLAAAAPLLIVPDRVLGSVPFAALRDRATGTFLVERAHLSMYAPGGSTARSTRTPRVLVASAADFDRRAFGDLPPLPGARAEAQRVHGLYGAATLLQDADVTPARLMDELQRHDVLHFAGHARALPATPEQSFLVTAADTLGSNRITAAQLARLDLRHVRLVVLGACSSAERGSVRSGDVSGIAQAFLTAGAASVIASVHDVDDAATAELLTRLHRHVAAGAAPADALRSAQLELLRSNDVRLREPRAWAGFHHYTS